MKLWYYEDWSDDILFSIKAKRMHYSEQSAFQQIDILESDDYGRFLTLDGLLMVTERDEFIYHEMIVHPAMCVNPDIRKVLVIGGGDGGTVRELTRYAQIECIDMVEIDELVVQAAKRYLPTMSSALTDERVNLYFEDGVKWVKNAKAGEYDLILVDSTDPIGPGEVLFTAEFYWHCHRVLSDCGILVNQQMNPIFEWDSMLAIAAYGRMKDIFPILRLYQAHIPTYASGLSLFGFASKNLDPVKDAKFDRWNELSLETKYYHIEGHVGAFMLPNYIRELFADGSSCKMLKQKKENKFVKLRKDFVRFRYDQKKAASNKLDLWFTEKWSKDTAFRIKVNRRLYGSQSKFQYFEIFENMDLGRFLVIDDFLMLTERDEFAYHEMIVHPAMCVNPAIRKVLVIGGGDGGTVRELTRYVGIFKIDMVEIDEQIVHACRQFLPLTASKLGDARVNLFFEDGVKWVQNVQDESYDLIIVDSTDPIGPGEGLFSLAFYQDCCRILTENGIMINQHASPYFENDAYEMKCAHDKIKQIFPEAFVYQVHIPTFASGHWLFGFASKSVDPLKNVDFDAWNALELRMKYYNTDVHRGSFALPTYVKELLNE